MSTERLDELILHWSQGTLSDSDAAALDAELRQSASSRQRFRRHARIDVALRDRASQPASTAWTPQPVRMQRWPRAIMALAACVAVLLCVAAFIMGGRQAPKMAGQPPEETNLGCAILTRTMDARWTGGTSQARLGDTLNSGTLHLSQGLAQIEFFSGATLLLEGDAELEILSPWEAVCHSGKARVRVPPPAHGFKLHAPGMKLVDLGTEFGLSVKADGQSEVQVFEGEVEAHPQTGAQINLKAGQGAHQEGVSLTRIASLGSQNFVGIEQLDQLSVAREKQRDRSWNAWSMQMRRDPRLIAYYPFLHLQDQKWDRLVRNAKVPQDKTKNGGAVGAAWTQGRWPDKDAVEFKRPGDRVRLRIDGSHRALTLWCWAKIDGLDRRYNALMLTDGYDPGEPHWQVYEDGRLMFSIMYPDAAGTRHNQIYFSPVVFTRSNTGRWHHLAVTYDNLSGEAVQYVDGNEVSREISTFHVATRPIVFGDCEIGNWGLPTNGHKFPIRNLNGAIDEFAIYHAALSGGEINAIYEAGKPE